MSLTRRTKFKEEVIKESEYLAQSIKPTTDGTKFICVPCNEAKTRPSLQVSKRESKGRHKKGPQAVKIAEPDLETWSFDGLLKHLKSEKHKATAKSSEEKDRLEAAIIYYENHLITTKKADYSNQSFKSKEGDELLGCEDSAEFDQNYFRLILTSFIIKNNLPFALANNLSKLVHMLLETFDAKALQTYALDRKEASLIARKCIGPFLQKGYLVYLESSPFSISLDEGSVKGNTEYLAIAVRYYQDSSVLSTKTSLLALLELKGSSTGETLFDLVFDLLFRGSGAQQRMNNFMGIASDKAANMISRGHAGVTNRFQEKSPYITVTLLCMISATPSI